MTRILCVDNYDSFVYTIVGYLRHLGAQVDVVRNDSITPELWQKLNEYDGVLISPGPGEPKAAGDMLDVVAACRKQRIPMLGVCLGHQGMGIVCGATVSHAPELFHGKTSLIHHDGTGLFRGLPNPLQVCRYHSLAITPDTVPDDVRVTAMTQDGIVMAIEHRELPLYGLQFHPESVLTECGHRMLGEWLKITGDEDAAERARDLAPIVASSNR